MRSNGKTSGSNRRCSNGRASSRPRGSRSSGGWPRRPSFVTSKRAATCSAWHITAASSPRRSASRGPFVETVFLSAPLHDLGKIGIPDAILHKPARLTDAEREIVKTHCEIGERILSGPRHSKQLLHFGVGSLPDDIVLRRRGSRAADGAGNRGLAPRTLGRRPAIREGSPEKTIRSFRPDYGDGRRLRCVDLHPPLQNCAIESDERFRIDPLGGGEAFRSRGVRGVPAFAGRIEEIRETVSRTIILPSNTPCVWRESPECLLGLRRLADGGPPQHALTVSQADLLNRRRGACWVSGWRQSTHSLRQHARVCTSRRQACRARRGNSAIRGWARDPVESAAAISCLEYRLLDSFYEFGNLHVLTTCTATLPWTSIWYPRRFGGCRRRKAIWN